jgi:hypothetical protein
VRDAFRVRGIESVADLVGVFQGLIKRQREFERLALDVLHDQEVWSNVVEMADIGMVQRGDGARFAFEPFGKLGLRCFDRHDSVQPRIPGFPHLPHAPGADGRKDLERAELLPDRQCHA